MWSEEDFYPNEYYIRNADGSISLVKEDPLSKEPQSELATEYYDQLDQNYL